MTAASIQRDLLMGLARRMPETMLQGFKRAARHPRYGVTVGRARLGFLRHGRRYPNPILFVAGLPKSGTSWLETMLAAYPGFEIVALPENTEWDYRHGGTHRLELPDDVFTRLRGTLSVLKLHCHGSQHNADLLRSHAIPYCVLHRDLRDAAVSHVFYVRRTPWHPEHSAYRALDTSAALLHFGRTLLPEWRDWIRSWKARRDPELSVEITYEQLRASTAAHLRRVARLFGLPEAPLEAIVSGASFGNMQRRGSFYRKGAVGDWRNHFDARTLDLFRETIGDDLVAWGYERDTSW